MFLPNFDDSNAPRTAHTQEAGEPLNLQSLDGDAHADVAIVGGGIAGCSAALHASIRGANVILLEAKTIGWGASGRNAGHVAPATKLSPQEVERRYGPDFGKRLQNAAEAGPDLVFDLAERHGMNAEVRRTGVLVAAHTKTAFQRLEGSARYLRDKGRPVEMYDQEAAAKAIGSSFYLGAYRDARGGSINPLAYVRGLAKAAIASGARIFEQTPVVQLKPDTAGWRLETPSGVVRARMVLICTNAYSDDLWPGLRQSIVSVRAYQMVTAPLAPHLLATILPGREPLTDTRRLPSGVRVTSDNRLHLSGLGAISGPEKGPDLAFSHARLAELFPEAGRLDLDFWWSGWMAMSSSNAWQLHRLAPGLVSAIGCNGRGIALATLLGRELGEYATGKQEADMILPFTPLKPMPLHRLIQPAVKGLVRYYGLLDRRDVRRRSQSASPRSTDIRQ